MMVVPIRGGRGYNLASIARRSGPRPSSPSLASCPTTLEDSPMTLLDSLKKYTTVVADTGDIEAIAKHKPQDATTNPSLLLQAAQQARYAHLVEDALQEAADQGGDEASQAEAFIDGR